MFRVCRSFKNTLALTIASFLATGCYSNAPTPTDLLIRFPTPIYSLTGERLLGGAQGQPTCDEAQTAWLQRVDTDHDGSIDLKELISEARKQFALMDINHDGTVTADELAVFRSGGPSSPSQAPDEEKDRRGVHRLQEHPQSSQPDPVLSADANLDFQVTLDEFLAQQSDNMSQFDKDKNQRLDAQELKHLCRLREQAATPSRR